VSAVVAAWAGGDSVVASGLRLAAADRNHPGCDRCVDLSLLLKKEGRSMKIYCIKPPRFVRRVIRLFIK